jgi:cell division septal protein FtsQ
MPADSTAGVPAAADRRFRRSTQKPGKRRSWQSQLKRFGLWIVAGVAIVGLTLWSVVALLDAPLFRIDRVVVQGNHRLASGEVRALLDGINHQSIFHVDLEEYRTRLLDSAWVADAVLWRVFPSTVEVHVTERTPLAVARLNRQAYLVDSTGVIIDSAGPHYREFDLPIVDGLLSDDVNGSGTLADPRKIQLVGRLFADLSTRGDLLKRVSQVDVSDPRNAVVLLDGEPARLYLGDREFLTRLQKYEEAAPAVREHLRSIDYYDLRFDRTYVGPAAGGDGGDSRAGK